MEVNIKQAIQVFFRNSSFEMIFFEAFANALDAGATDFSVNIELSNKEDIENLTLIIADNGVGFTDHRFSKFGKLFDVEEQSHKGLGRLVYLCYFQKVDVVSYYDDTKWRQFLFSEDFANKSEVIEVPKHSSGTTLRMSLFRGKRVAKWERLTARYILNSLREKFYFRLYQAKQAGNNITISVQSYIDKISRTRETFQVFDLPDLNRIVLDKKINILDTIELYYYIKKVESPYTNGRIVTAIGVDGRCQMEDIITTKNLPYDYEMMFLLVSESFRGRVDELRQNLRIDEVKLRRIKSIFREAIADVIRRELPFVEAKNRERKTSLETKYPHLCGYFNMTDVECLALPEVLKKAQDMYFSDQREILGAEHLTDEQFDKSITLSARSLAEYIIFRQNVVKRLKSLSNSDREKDLHNIIAPQRTEFKSDTIIGDIYRNNVWLMDDRFMSYCTVLSEAEMTRVIDVLTAGEVIDRDRDRPDITLFFSSDPTDVNTKVDVVVVELKRLGLKADQNVNVELQLEKRAIQLAKYYGNRIQRMWFYGIVDMDDQYKLHLKNNGYVPLFSKGSIYYKSKDVYTDLDSNTKVLQNSYLMDYNALVEDADSRNSTFLKIIQNRLLEDEKGHFA